MRKVSIRKCVRKDGTIDIIKIEGGNTGARKNKPQIQQASQSKEKTEVDIASKLADRIDLETGVVLRNSKSLHKTMRMGREIVRYNVVDMRKTCQLYRLGYYPHNFDFNRASVDFERFIRRVRNKYEPEFGKIHYMNVIDLYKDLSIHFHGILYAPSTKKLLKISKSDLEKLWGQGSISLRRHRKSLEYLFPIPTNTSENYGLHMKEKFSRYLRLPDYIKIYRSSGFEKPVYQEISLKEYEELKATKAPTFSRKFSYTYQGNKLDDNDNSNGYGIVTYTYETFKSQGAYNNENKE